MRSFVLMGMFAASLANASWKEYTEDRDLNLAASGLSSIDIVAGSGSMNVRGESGGQNIVVEAIVKVGGVNDDEARAIIAEDLVLMIERDGNKATLRAYFDGSGKSYDDASVHLKVSIPTGLALIINDGSGSIEISGTQGDVRIDDGSGSIEVSNTGNLVIEDGSGSIDVADASGDVSIIDGSGSISIDGVGGSVRIDDGSGSIRVRDVEQDVILEDDGSGSFNYSNVRGRVEQES